MEADVLKLKCKLLDAIDRNHNVRDAETITEVLEGLENIEINEELLRSTRLGKIVNDLRRNLKDETLAKRAKQLVKRWRKYILLRAGAAIVQGTRMGNGQANNIENYADVDSTDGKKMSHEWAANGNSKTRNCDSTISKERYGLLGANATRSSSVQEQEPAAEVFDNKMRNDSLNRFVEGKCKNLASTIRATKEMVVTMNPQDWDAKKHFSVTDNKSLCEQKVHRGQQLTTNMQLSGCAKMAKAATNFTPRKKVKTTQELIKTVLNNSDLPEGGARNLCAQRIGSQTSRGEHIKTCELKLQPKRTFVPSSTPVTEDHLLRLEDSNNGRVGTSAEQSVSTAAESPANHEDTVAEKRDVPGKTVDASPDETIREVQPELTVSASELNVTDSSVVQCEEAVTVKGYEDANCSVSFVKIEGVTGIFDEGPGRNETDDGFREWHECLSKRSYKGDLLSVLPYVVID